MRPDSSTPPDERPAPRRSRWPALPDGITPAHLSSLTVDEFARWVLDHGLYDVDPETGVVLSLRTGRPMAPQRRGQMGYAGVGLRAGTVGRSITIHRLIAVKVWGVEACRGKEVAHLD